MDLFEGFAGLLLSRRARESYLFRTQSYWLHMETQTLEMTGLSISFQKTRFYTKLFQQLMSVKFVPRINTHKNVFTIKIIFCHVDITFAYIFNGVECHIYVKMYSFANLCHQKRLLYMYCDIFILFLWWITFGMDSKILAGKEHDFSGIQFGIKTQNVLWSITWTNKVSRLKCFKNILCGLLEEFGD